MSVLSRLFQRIDEMDLKRPYVWRLRISEGEFDALEAAVEAERTTPLQNVVYLAEWYKRRYDGGRARPVREFDCASLFSDSGIDQANNLFETENGNKVWQYSIFVLGGVAIPFELGKRDTRFLKELCRIYYGEEGDVDRLGGRDRGRAIAFRESVRRRGSLYEFVQAALSDGKPFAEDDLSDDKSQVNLFLKRIEHANDEVLKSKFDLEWVIGYERAAAYMTRKLRLTLKPESLGGLNHQYLKFERVRQWGIARPEICKRLLIGVRFYQDREIVAEPDFAKPILEFATTGNAATGFVAWQTERRSRKIDAPTGRFNAVEIVAKEDAGAEHSVEVFKLEPWMQVFRVPDKYNEWTSQHCAQRESALICPSDFEILEAGVPAEIQRKSFWAKGETPSERFQWRPIVDKVIFHTSDGQEIALYNRQGYDQIVAWPHRELLRYRDGLVCYSEESEDEIEETLLPLVFGRQDLIVRHFETRNDLQEDPDGAEFEEEDKKIEFLDRGAYREWTDAEAPHQGKTILRVTVKGVPRRFVVYFLPIEITRNCDRGEITCGDEVLSDRIVRDGSPTEPVYCKSFGSDSAFVSLEIWRPTKHKEIIRGDKVVRYVEDGESASVSYVLKDDLVIHDFSENGFREYRCSDIGSVYRLPFFDPTNDSHLQAYESAVSVRVADALDDRAPDWLEVNLSARFAKDETVKLYYWDYLPGSVLREVEDDSVCQGDDVVFHGLRDYKGISVFACRISEPNPFSDTGDALRANLVGCFEMATEHRVYYFLMQPLREANIDLLKDLYEPLKAKRGGRFSEEDRLGLFRLAEEFGFDWGKKYGVAVD